MLYEPLALAKIVSNRTGSPDDNVAFLLRPTEKSTISESVTKNSPNSELTIGLLIVFNYTYRVISLSTRFSNCQNIFVFTYVDLR